MAVDSSRRPKKKHQEHPRYDQQLLAAKNKGTEVKFQLSVETSFTDEDGRFSCAILEVCRYNIKVLVGGTLISEVWVGKPFIVSTEIQS